MVKLIMVESTHSVVTFCNKHQKGENSKKRSILSVSLKFTTRTGFVENHFEERCFKDLCLPFGTSELKMVRNRNRINYAWLDTYLLLPCLATFLLSSSVSS